MAMGGASDGEPMSPARAITGALAGASFTFGSDAADLMAYAGHHLGPLATPAASTPVVTAALRWHEGQPPLTRPQPRRDHRLDRIDRDLYREDGHLHWFRVDDLRDLHLHVSWGDDRLRVQGDFYHRLGNRWFTDKVRRMASWRRGASLRQRRFTTLLSYLVYYPCWWWHEQMHGMHPIHAAGVETDAGTILLAGASGVGKSSLAIALANAPGARLLADSFVLHNGTAVLPVREPILLDDWSRDWLGALGEGLRPIDWRYGLRRRGYLLPADRLAEMGQAAVLIFPQRSSESYTRSLGAEEACRRLSASNLIINDLRRYWAFAAVLEQLLPSGLVARREAELARLASAVPAYEIGLRVEQGAADAAAAVCGLLRGEGRRAAGAAV
jgi:hypothetical protein